MMKKLALLAALLWSGLAQAQFATTTTTAPTGDSTNRIASTQFVQQNGMAGVNITAPPFNAVCDGTTDDAVPIQLAINSLPANGGVVYFPPRTCAIGNGIAIGNGTSSTASTRSGTILQGLTQPTTQFGFNGFVNATGPRLKWIGSTNNTMLQVQGPLQGWGINNLQFDCNSVAGVNGLQVISAQAGNSSNLSFNNCFGAAIEFTPFSLFGSLSNTDSFHNTFINTAINVGNAAGAFGILLTGQVAGTSNSDYNDFYGVQIALPGGSNTVNGIYLQSADTNSFSDVHMFPTGANANMRCIVFDYSLVNTFPSANRLVGVDVSTCGGGTPVLNAGTPGASARPNQLYINEANAMVCPSIANLACFGSHNLIPSLGANNAVQQDVFGAWQTFTPSPSCGTASFTINSARFKNIGKTTLVNGDFTISAIGTCAAPNITFTLPNTPQVNGAFAYRDQNTSLVGSIVVLSGSTTATATTFNGSPNFAVNTRLIFDGAYENQ